MAKNADQVFSGGVPTGPDVKRLFEAFPSPKSEVTIKHDEIEKVVGVDRKSSRYRVVTLAWRRKLRREANIDMEPIPGVGFMVLTENGKVSASARDHRHAVRRIGRASKRIQLVRTEVLQESEQRQAEHVRRLINASLAAGQDAAREISIRISPQEANPRLMPGPLKVVSK